MDTQTAAAIAAIVIAVLAMMIALGQVVQQYASSGHQYRLCDSVVYGGETGLPGMGRRVWSFDQLRFRVVYDVPAFRLAQHGTHVSAGRVADVNIDLNEQYLERLQGGPRVGEASWVSFCRKVKEPCADRVAISLLTGDADRCPPDLPNIPMPVSFRDVVIMAFAAGIDCVEASFTVKTLSMQGNVGSITTSQHPVLGPLIHFTPEARDPVGLIPRNWARWLGRLSGLLPVGDELLAEYGRRGLAYVEEKDETLFRLIARLEEDGSSEVTTDASSSKSLANSVIGRRAVGTRENDMPDEIPALATEHPRPTAEPRTPALKRHGNPRISSIEDGGFAPILRDTIRGKTFIRHPTITRRHIDTLHHGNTNAPSISWYWMSQMNIFEGPWATPWKLCANEKICRYAFKAIRDEILALERMTLYFDLHDAATELMHVFRLGMPFQTYPPYATYGASQGTREKTALVQDMHWIHFPAFGCKLPKIILFFEGLTFNLIGPASGDTRIYTMELMRFDHWLWRASETRAIGGGGAKVLSTAPAIIEYVMRLFAGDFEGNYITSVRTRESGQAIWATMKGIGLSDAESIFMFVAILRTLRVAICISTGLDTSQTLEILDKDIRAHMV